MILVSLALVIVFAFLFAVVVVVGFAFAFVLLLVLAFVLAFSCAFACVPVSRIGMLPLASAEARRCIRSRMPDLCLAVYCRLGKKMHTMEKRTRTRKRTRKAHGRH